VVLQTVQHRVHSTVQFILVDSRNKIKNTKIRGFLKAF
jgi:hypothetical protein